MKKGRFLVLAGMLAVALTFGFSSCGKKGGTVTLKNGTNADAELAVAAGRGTVIPKDSQIVKAGASISASIDEDGKYVVRDYHSGTEKSGDLTGGEDVNLTWDGTDFK